MVLQQQPDQRHMAVGGGIVQRRPARLVDVGPPVDQPCGGVAHSLQGRQHQRTLIGYGARLHVGRLPGNQDRSAPDGLLAHRQMQRVLSGGVARVGVKPEPQQARHRDRIVCPDGGKKVFERT